MEDASGEGGRPGKTEFIMQGTEAASTCDVSHLRGCDSEEQHYGHREISSLGKLVGKACVVDNFPGDFHGLSPLG